MHMHVHAVYNIVYNDTNASPNISNHVVEHPQSISVQVCVSFGGFFVPFASINNTTCFLFKPLVVIGFELVPFC